MKKENMTICEWKKDKIQDDFEKLKSLVLQPKFICKKCGRAANSEEFLCKPKKIDN